MTPRAKTTSPRPAKKTAAGSTTKKPAATAGLNTTGGKTTEKTRLLFIAGAIALSAVLAIFVWLWSHQNYQNSPTYALEALEQAIYQRNAEAVEKGTDLTALSTSLMTQVYSPQVAEGQTPWQEMSNKLTGRIAGLVIPSLAGSLADAMLEAVKTGEPGQSGNLILRRLWDDFAGMGPDNLEFRGIFEVVRNEEKASAKLRFYRADLDHGFTLTAKMAEQGKTGWVVTDLPDFGLALSTLIELEQAKKEAEQAERAAAMRKMLHLNKLQAVPTDAERGAEAGLQVQLAIENHGPNDVKQFNANLEAHVGKELLKAYPLSVNRPLAVGEVLEQTLPLKLDLDDARDVALYNTLEDADFRLQPVFIELADGTILSVE